jgi:hypothetical protein
MNEAPAGNASYLLPSPRDSGKEIRGNSKKFEDHKPLSLNPSNTTKIHKKHPNSSKTTKPPPKNTLTKAKQSQLHHEKTFQKGKNTHF